MARTLVSAAPRLDSTIVTGHIRRLDQYLAPKRRFVMALEFYRFEFPRGPARFFAGLEKIAASRGSAAVSIVPTPDLPGVATFSVNGDSLLLPPGTRMPWKASRYKHEDYVPVSGNPLPHGRVSASRVETSTLSRDRKGAVWSRSFS